MLVITLISIIALLNLQTVTLQSKLEHRIKVFKATIAEVTNNTITIQVNNTSIRLLSLGKWIIVSDGIVDFCKWNKIKGYVKQSEALVVVLTVRRMNKTLSILLGLRQENLTLFRPQLLKFAIYKRRHGTFEFACKLLAKGNSLILIEARKFKFITVVKGKWIKAGDGIVSWSDVVNEFNVGDRLWICCHNIVVFKPKFIRIFGVHGLIYGFSGALIDIDSGIALVKYPQ